MLGDTGATVEQVGEEMMSAQMMAAQHEAVMDGLGSMTEPVYDAGWYGDTCVDGSGFTYDSGGY
jgi:hypothetical protein